MSSLKPTVVGLGISLPLLAIVAVAFRFHARRINKLSIGIDDYLSVVALFFTILVCATCLAGVFVGNLGGHLELGPGANPLHTTEFKAFSIALWVLQFISIPAFGFAKLTTLFFYKRIFNVPRFRFAAWFLIAIVIIWTVAFFLANLLDCLPFNLNWQPWSQSSGQCSSVNKFTPVLFVSDVVTDGLILVLPWYEIWKLHMSISNKIRVGFMFLLGWVVVGAGIARCVYTIGNVSLGNDIYHSAAIPVAWTITEATLGVIGTCLPTLGPLLSQYSRLGSGASSLRNLLSRLRTSSSSSTSSTEKTQKTYRSGSLEPVLANDQINRPSVSQSGHYVLPPMPSNNSSRTAEEGLGHGSFSTVQGGEDRSLRSEDLERHAAYGKF